MKSLYLLLMLTAGISVAFNSGSITKSAVTFKIKNLGINTGGSIGGLQADVQFSPADLSAAKIEASVDAATINTDNSSRDEHLKSEDYFDVIKYPKITLKSISIKHKSGNNYSGEFNLTIKGKTKLMEIPFVYTEKGNDIVFNSTFKLNRLDFGIGNSSMILSNEVTVNVEAEETK